jgi:hypothetical protein
MEPNMDHVIGITTRLLMLAPIKKAEVRIKMTSWNIENGILDVLKWHLIFHRARDGY